MIIIIITITIIIIIITIIIIMVIIRLKSYNRSLLSQPYINKQKTAKVNALMMNGHNVVLEFMLQILK